MPTECAHVITVLNASEKFDLSLCVCLSEHQTKDNRKLIEEKNRKSVCFVKRKENNFETENVVAVFECPPSGETIRTIEIGRSQFQYKEHRRLETRRREIGEFLSQRIGCVVFSFSHF